MARANAIRVGVVQYLNAKPLYYRLAEFAPDARLVMDYPSALADRLAAGELDVALIPSVEYLRGERLACEIIPGFAIAARGPVRSVKLYARVPFQQIERLALDAGSRTSQVLARVWLDVAHGVRPTTIEPLPFGVPVEESTADAVLVIGDRAMKPPAERFAAVVDLAGEWIRLTGLPFVFALWVARAGVDLGHLPDALAISKREGIAHAAELAAEHGPILGLDAEFCYDYLTNVISYDLGDPELAGLRRFAEMAAALDLAPKGAELVFHRERDRQLDPAARR